MPVTTTETRGRRVWMLLDLDLSGMVLRFTDSPNPLVVTDNAGYEYTYQPGLVSPKLARTSASLATTMSASILATAEVGWAKLLSRGHILERAAVVVRRWYVGQILEAADIWIRGKLTQPSWGDASQPISFTIKRLRRESGVIPLDTMLIGATTWPVTVGFTLAEDAIGAWYPMVYGQPTSSLTPAYMVEFDATNPANCKLLIAGHAVGATSVTLHDTKGEQSAVATVYTMDDLLGREVSYVKFDGLSFAPEADREYRIAWDQDAGGYSEAGVTLDGSGEIVLHLLKKWTDMHIDNGRFAAAENVLNAYRLAFVITGQVSVWDWVDGRILDILPMEWTESNDGEYPQLWNLDAVGITDRGHIDCTKVTGRYTRVGRIQSVGSPITNRFTLQYSMGGAQGRPQKSATLGSGLSLKTGNLDTSDGTIPHPLCANSERIFGRRAASVRKTEVIDDETTAKLILNMWALLHALPRRSIQVEGDLSLDEHKVNEVVTVTATDVEITDERALVRGKSHKGEVVTLDLVLLDNPMMKVRSTT